MSNVGPVKKILLILLFLTFSSSVFADDKMVLGLDIYNNKAQCGVCHTLQAAGSSGDIGPNLDQLKPSIGRIIYVVTNGIGVMQAWGYFNLRRNRSCGLLRL